jgi:hypothetical protein
VAHDGRKEEVRSLTWKQVDFAAGEGGLEVGTTKSGRGWMLPFIASPVLEALLRLSMSLGPRKEIRLRAFLTSPPECFTEGHHVGVEGISLLRPSCIVMDPRGFQGVSSYSVGDS